MLHDISLTIHNLDCHYHDYIILRHVNLSLRSGDILGLQGCNGCGKSTLLKTIAGIISHDSDRITITENDITKVCKPHHIAFFNTLNSLYPEITIYNNLKLWSLLHGTSNMIETALNSYGLMNHAHKPVNDLSRGFLQRVNLSKLLLTPARIWLLDEPLTGLDVAGYRLFTEVAHAFQDKGNIIIVAPELPDVQNMVINIESFNVESF